jgi:hypothetical protein
VEKHQRRTNSSGDADSKIITWYHLQTRHPPFRLLCAGSWSVLLCPSQYPDTGKFGREDIGRLMKSQLSQGFKILPGSFWRQRFTSVFYL